ncbi:hypothetical protein CEXT_210031 [Caerostris extrusa]|uniref:Uncharacterized protein n=1 Tax=Caerostris extrusa TaxID=172846 RepID=A0AAV4R3H0_CAEEX|nr:hypothetical protein CEXT_210031 [Caerostris extrusa]
MFLTSPATILPQDLAGMLREQDRVAPSVCPAVTWLLGDDTPTCLGFVEDSVGQVKCGVDGLKPRVEIRLAIKG